MLSVARDIAAFTVLIWIVEYLFVYLVAGADDTQNLNEINTQQISCPLMKIYFQINDCLYLYPIFEKVNLH